jgi:hypothetical protein
MIGARQLAGSTISNGGDSSPSCWVIVGRRPWNPLLWQLILPEKRSFYERAFSVITTILPSEKLFNPLECLSTTAKRPSSLHWAAFRSRNKIASLSPFTATLHPKFTLCRAK